MKRSEERYAWGTCVCGKRGYPSRKAAKNRAKAYHPGDTFDTYRCLRNDQVWHYGHLGPDGRDFYREAS